MQNTSRSRGFRRVQALEEGLNDAYQARRKKEIKNPTNWEPTQLYVNRPPETKQCNMVKRSDMPSALRDGRFSFWRDVRGPFTITGLQVFSDDLVYNEYNVPTPADIPENHNHMMMGSSIWSNSNPNSSIDGYKSHPNSSTDGYRPPRTSHSNRSKRLLPQQQRCSTSVPGKRLGSTMHSSSGYNSGVKSAADIRASTPDMYGGISSMLPMKPGFLPHPDALKERQRLWNGLDRSHNQVSNVHVKQWKCEEMGRDITTWPTLGMVKPGATPKNSPKNNRKNDDASTNFCSNDRDSDDMMSSGDDLSSQKKRERRKKKRGSSNKNSPSSNKDHLISPGDSDDTRVPESRYGKSSPSSAGGSLLPSPLDGTQKSSPTDSNVRRPATTPSRPLGGTLNGGLSIHLGSQTSPLDSNMSMQSTLGGGSGGARPTTTGFNYSTILPHGRHIQNSNPEYQWLYEHNEEFRKIPLRKLNEIFKVEYEGYLNYDIERLFRNNPEDRRVYGIAIVHIPLNYQRGPLKVLSWGNHYDQKISVMDKRLEFLFKPESKKAFGPTKGIMPADNANTKRTERPERSLSPKSSRDSSPSRSPETRKPPKWDQSLMGTSATFDQSMMSTQLFGSRSQSADPNSDWLSRRLKFNRTGVRIKDNWHTGRDPWTGQVSTFCGSPDVTSRILDDTLQKSLGRSYTHLQQSRYYDPERRMWVWSTNRPTTRGTSYKDPDLHHNTMHTSKIMRVDRSPFHQFLM